MTGLLRFHFFLNSLSNTVSERFLVNTLSLLLPLLGKICPTAFLKSQLKYVSLSRDQLTLKGIVVAQSNTFLLAQTPCS